MESMNNEKQEYIMEDKGIDTGVNQLFESSPHYLISYKNMDKLCELQLPRFQTGITAPTALPRRNILGLKEGMYESTKHGFWRTSVTLEEE